MTDAKKSRKPTERRNLTRSHIVSLPFPETGESWHWDSQVKELAVRVRRGAKTFVVKKWRERTSVLSVIGKFPSISVDDARKIARERLVEIAHGEDPNAKKRALRARAATLGEVLQDYLNNRKLKQSTIEDYTQIANRCFKEWLMKPITDISKDMIERKHKALSNLGGPKGKGEAQANLAMRLLRSIFNYAGATHEDAQGRSILPENPVKRLSQKKMWNRVERRQSMIKRHELKSWYQAVKALGNDTMRDYLLLCIFTGLRRNEAAALEWKNVDFNADTLKVEDTKNHQDHTLPLTTFLHDMLKARWDGHKNEYVFPATGREEGHLVEPKKAIAEVTRKSGVEFMVHDLRRTFLTIAENLDIPHYALKRLANHKNSSDVTAGYIVSDVERLRDPMSLITQYLCREMGLSGYSDVEQSADVIELKTAQAK